MQLSAANILIAAQQTAKQAPQAKSPGFSAAPAAETRKDALFAPLDFRQTAEAAPVRAQASPTPAARPGANLDIRV